MNVRPQFPQTLPEQNAVFFIIPFKLQQNIDENTKKVP